MDAFEKALAETLEFEGGYSDDPADYGGKTKCGITEAVARHHGYEGPMRALPPEKINEIYRKDYWNRIRLNEIAAYHEPLALKLFDIAVNMGIDDAANFLQRSINTLSRNQEIYPYLKVDNVIGSKTIATLKKLGCDGEKTVILRMINVLQGAKYLWICEKDSTQEKFIRGWYRRVA